MCEECTYVCHECSDEMSLKESTDGMCPWCDEEMEMVPCDEHVKGLDE